MSGARSRVASHARGTASRFPQKPIETLAADRTIGARELNKYQGFAFDPGGAGRAVNLPAEAASAGAFLMISNEADAAEILTIKNDGGGTILTPTQNESAVLWCDGVNWYGLVGSAA